MRLDGVHGWRLTRRATRDRLSIEWCCPSCVEAARSSSQSQVRMRAGA